jgi:NDP-sugar pyrophosphorylase family protein
MGYKLICVDCRKAFSIGTDFSKFKEKICPECGKMMIRVSHLFQPPKKDDKKQWKMIQFLIDNGFKFEHSYKYIEKGTWLNIPYPTNLKEAKEFVEKYAKDKDCPIYIYDKSTFSACKKQEK